MNAVPNSADIAGESSESLRYMLSVLSTETRTKETEELMHDVEQLMHDLEQPPGGIGSMRDNSSLTRWEHWEHWGLNE